MNVPEPKCSLHLSASQQKDSVTGAWQVFPHRWTEDEQLGFLGNHHPAEQVSDRTRHLQLEGWRHCTQQRFYAPAVGSTSQKGLAGRSQHLGQCSRLGKGCLCVCSKSLFNKSTRAGLSGSKVTTESSLLKC